MVGWCSMGTLNGPCYLSIYLNLSICLSICLSIYLFIYLSIIYLPIYLSVCLSLYLSIFVSIYLYIYLSIFLSIYLSFFLSIYFSFYLSIYPSIYLSVCLSIYLSRDWICLYVWFHIPKSLFWSPFRASWTIRGSCPRHLSWLTLLLKQACQHRSSSLQETLLQRSHLLMRIKADFGSASLVYFSRGGQSQGWTK